MIFCVSISVGYRSIIQSDCVLIYSGNRRTYSWNGRKIPEKFVKPLLWSVHIYWFWKPKWCFDKVLFERGYQKMKYEKNETCNDGSSIQLNVLT